MTFDQELSVAIAAVKRAAQVCQAVQRAIPSAMAKQDKSPVTIADFASQAVICQALGEAFPNDPVIGEEDSAELRLPENKAFLDRVQTELGLVGLNASPDEICRWIDQIARYLYWHWLRRLPQRWPEPERLDFHSDRHCSTITSRQKANVSPADGSLHRG